MISENIITINELILKIKNQEAIKGSIKNERKVIISRMIELGRIIDNKKNERLNTPDSEMFIVKETNQKSSP